METFSYRDPRVGEPFTSIIEGTHAERVLSLDSVAGRYVVVCCIGSSCDPRGSAALRAVLNNERLFDNRKTCFIGVTIDPSDHRSGRLPAATDGVFFIADTECRISRHCGAAPLAQVPCGTGYRITWMVIDPTLHVLACFNAENGTNDWHEVFDYLCALPEPSSYGACEITAPILTLPNVFESVLCDRLVQLYEGGESRESGFMRGNKEVFDSSFKVRRDYFVSDEEIKSLLRKRIAACIVPEIRKLFFMDVTRMERFLIACYAAEENGHFQPHRDNGQKVTAHRRFAVSVALNDDFEGGDLLFPEYSQRRHKIPKGWAIVFPCAILHAVERVRRGRRYAFLPFLYDEAGAAIKVNEI